MVRAVRRVAPVWKWIARNLQSEYLKPHDIEVIEMNAPEDVVKQSKAMLERWWKKEKKNAPVRSLCKAIVEANRRSDAEDLFGEGAVAISLQNESTV
jgi:hypothetical protein